MDVCKPSSFRRITTCDKFSVIKNIEPIQVIDGLRKASLIAS